MIRFWLAVSIGCAGCSTAEPYPDGGGNSTGSSGNTRANGACAGLGQTACQARSDCVADFCDRRCGSCGPAFQDCRAVGSAPQSCIHFDCTFPPCDDLDAGWCRSDEVCAAQEAQPAIWDSWECCSCTERCADDSACAGGICEPSSKCGCGNVCQPGCQTAGCPIGMQCQSSGHCLATPCAVNGACPAFFQCGAAGRCERTPCSGTCPGGSCVRGQCWPYPGICRIATP